jgi:hypothetical protein
MAEAPRPDERAALLVSAGEINALRQFCERVRAKSWQQRERRVARYR